MPDFLALDLGTTNFKAALIDPTGRMLVHASQTTPLRHRPTGDAIYDPQEVWEVFLSLLARLDDGRPQPASKPGAIAAIGIASMAETGLLVEHRTGTPRTPFLPWFDPLAARQADSLAARPTFAEEFCRHGVRPTFKCSLAKLLWLQAQDAALLDGATWLSLADYIAFRLTGAVGTQASLAVRTAAFCLQSGEWDFELLETLNLPANIFPPVLPAFQAAGRVRPGLQGFGLAAGTPVIIAGHDHLCGAFAAYAIASGENSGAEFARQEGSNRAPGAAPGAPQMAHPIYQSIGTAESLVGAFPARPLGEADLGAGFSYSQQAMPGQMAWVGGISASGGSIEWLRGVLGDPPLSYEALSALLKAKPRPPTGIVYLPYLSGSGSPHSNGRARAAFIGLDASHSRADLYQAVLEGVAYEVEYIRRKAQGVNGQEIQRMVVAGGGARNRAWMQIRADVLGFPLAVLNQPEMTLLGAAVLAGLGAGIYTNPSEAGQALEGLDIERYLPDAARHAAYRQIYEDSFARWVSWVTPAR